MGWLDVNVPLQKRKEDVQERSEQIKKARLKRSYTPEGGTHVPSGVPGQRSLASLPKELLEKIFIYSGNLELPLTSREIWAKLRPSYYLESQFLLEQLNEGALPAASLMLPFVEAKLLKQLGIRRFEPMHVPHRLVTTGETSLLVYLLQCGMIMDNATVCYERFLAGGENEGLKLLLAAGVSPSKANMLQAVELGTKYASRMAALWESSREDLEQIWELAQNLQRKRVLKVLGDQIG